MRPMRAHFVAPGAGAVLLAFLPAAADFAQDNTATRPTFSSGYRFVEMTGEELFANVCQGCHMPDASGAAGAGAYPSLIANRNLATSSYAVHLVVNGRRGMPAFGDMMTDGQVAAVVNYLRTHFDNSYTDAVTAREVAEARR
ncbi:cytochrome c [Bradyrhizobium sp. Leo170]|uniref:c-type cytochrome n=1 Tax=Bradyrhizobium sp. Leo170 TaxID=1571199 RepID=UPI001FE0699B|nr:cytochrome c [Bradyrhizobium sp. Leo170]